MTSSSHLISRITSYAILQPLQLALFLSLHLAYGLFRLLTHLRHRPSLIKAEASAASLPEDVQRWKALKVPHHLALAFTPSENVLRMRTSLDQGIRLEELKKDLEKACHWSLAAGVSRLTVYDPQGLLKSSSEIITDHLDSTFSIQKRSAAQYTLSLDSHSLDLCFLDQRDGKQLLATVTDQLSSGVQAAHIQAADITVPFLQQKMASAGYDDPQLLIVLGGDLLQLHEYPPWTIRLTEIYHEPSLGLLGPARLSYHTFRSALDSFAGCQMRFGK